MKYTVTCSIPVHLSIEVEAEDKDSAIDAAMEYASLGGYSGNGGTGKLVGTSCGNVTIDPGDEVLEGNGFEITVEEYE